MEEINSNQNSNGNDIISIVLVAGGVILFVATFLSVIYMISSGRIGGTTAIMAVLSIIAAAIFCAVLKVIQEIHVYIQTKIDYLQSESTHTNNLTNSNSSNIESANTTPNQIKKESSWY